VNLHNNNKGDHDIFRFLREKIKIVRKEALFIIISVISVARIEFSSIMGWLLSLFHLPLTHDDQDEFMDIIMMITHLSKNTRTKIDYIHSLFGSITANGRANPTPVIGGRSLPCNMYVLICVEYRYFRKYLIAARAPILK
jgi:hypothetical protein